MSRPWRRDRDGMRGAFSAAALSATRTCGKSIGLSQIIPAAPAAIALSMNLCPSVASPFIAMKRSPCVTSRESKATPCTVKSALALPPVDEAMARGRKEGGEGKGGGDSGAHGGRRGSQKKKKS